MNNLFVLSRTIPVLRARLITATICPLKFRAGRYDPSSDSWVLGSVTSPAPNEGRSNQRFDDETEFASQSLIPEIFSNPNFFKCGDGSVDG